MGTSNGRTSGYEKTTDAMDWTVLGISTTPVVTRSLVDNRTTPITMACELYSMQPSSNMECND